MLPIFKPLTHVLLVVSDYSWKPGYTVLYRRSNTALNIPMALQEMVFAVWLIVKGFNKVNIYS